ncbi:MAG: hypothetical protein ACK4YP_14905, partial [Myxococcota bacterium]
PVPRAHPRRRSYTPLMWLLAAAALNVALAEEPRRVGPHTGDFPVYRPETEISCPGMYEIVQPFYRVYREGERPPRPRHARADFRAAIDASARLAVPVDRAAP